VAKKRSAAEQALDAVTAALCGTATPAQLRYRIGECSVKLWFKRYDLDELFALRERLKEALKRERRERLVRGLRKRDNKWVRHAKACEVAAGDIDEWDPTADTKPTNPKDIIGSSKLPLHLWPATASAMGCIGLLEGMLKYGRQNWRPSGVRASIYVDACKRHLDAWFEGEDHAPDSGVPHLANALACLAILVDAQAAGVLNDDRAYPGGYRSLVESLTPHVARLQALHAERSPKHWGIGDAP
jgi:hypothetical protein